jgi:hypothetical protein
MKHNEKFLTMYDIDGEEWKYGYVVYAQNVKGEIFVTFFKKDYYEKIHFNNSGSIDINAYLKPYVFQEMLDYAKGLGW